MRLLWLIFFLIPVCLSAQTFPVDAASGKIYYAEEVLVKDGPKSDLYNRAKAWFASSKNKKTLNVDDVANGLLIGSNYCMLLVQDGHKDQPFRLWYTVKIEMEDDRYWYSLSNFKIQKDTIPEDSVSGENKKLMQPLELLVLSKNAGNTVRKADLFYKSLVHAAHNSILVLIKDIKVNML